MPLRVEILFKHVGTISSGSWLDQHSNIKEYLGDLSRICMGSLKDHTRIIMGSKCNEVSILTGTH